ncbi:hypothetical protein CC86DRAFT_394660 [Ophiobolus disseminans]|uniref:Uncharacterized protein n=1 Tax=Ophiobolus disseminans TaxID=1469910 RepID=A0A6A6ZXP4_9PLEO|nr:hypothetical protein CC86DRAFT_394660 [Ophiobolus disseminans]
MSTHPPPAFTHRRKRVRFAPSSSSSPTMSDASTLAPADDSTAASSHDSSSDSDLSESSEDPSSESSSEDEDDEVDATSDDNPEDRLAEHTGRNGITNLRAGQGTKPTMKFDETELGPDIRTFLKDFLPQLKASNEELERQRVAGTLKGREIDATEGGEGEAYIEMDLGLGVLEEKDGEESGSDEEMEDGQKEKDVLGKLMGGRDTKEGAVIQEVKDRQS